MKSDLRSLHPALAERLSLVILTHNRREEVLHAVAHALSLPERIPVIVVDNGSRDGTAAAVARRFPQAQVVPLERNLGAAARNLGAAVATTEYVAFADDDTLWAPGSLARAAELLDRWPRIAVLSARVLVGPAAREDPACREMAASPLPSQGLPGPALLGYLAGACVFRRTAFFDGGGYDPQFFIGGEEALLALDLVARGWSLVYADALTVHHLPSPRRDAAKRRHLLARNALWVAWLRRPWRSAAARSVQVLRAAAREGVALRAFAAALARLPWVLRRREPLPAPVEALYRRLEHRRARPGPVPQIYLK